MKRIVSVFLSLLLVLCPFSSAALSAGAAEKPLCIVTTIFPVYDWVMNILGDRAAAAEVSLLLDSGVDLHSYQPTVDDLVKIAACDLFIYVGGESDEWVEDALAEAVNRDMQVINLLDALGDAVKEEEFVEGMQAEEEHDHEGEEAHDHEDEGEHHHHEGEVEYDEHVWLSLRNASVLCGVIADTLGQLDPEHAEAYRANVEAYAGQLSALDDAYQRVVDDAPVKTLLFGDRFPFRYLVDDYGLDYYAAFVGCSAETEASFETVVFLAEKVDELRLHAICQIESADGKLARTIQQNTQSRDQTLVTFDSMQSTTARDVHTGRGKLPCPHGAKPRRAGSGAAVRRSRWRSSAAGI